MSDVKNNLSRYIEQVRRGERFRILSHGRPVAELVPIGRVASDGDPSAPALVELERRGILRRGSAKLPELLLEPAPEAAGRPLSDYVREERTDDR